MSAQPLPRSPDEGKASKEKAEDKLSGEGVPSKEKVDGKKKNEPDAVEKAPKPARRPSKQKTITGGKRSKGKIVREASQEKQPVVDKRKMDGVADVKKERDEDKMAKQPKKKMPNKAEEREYEETAAPSRPAVDTTRPKTLAEILAEALANRPRKLLLDDKMTNQPNKTEETEYEETAAPSRPAVDTTRPKTIQEMWAEAKGKMPEEPNNNNNNTENSDREEECYRKQWRE